MFFPDRSIKSIETKFINSFDIVYILYFIIKHSIQIPLNYLNINTNIVFKFNLQID